MGTTNTCELCGREKRAGSHATAIWNSCFGHVGKEASRLQGVNAFVRVVGYILAICAAVLAIEGCGKGASQAVEHVNPQHLGMAGLQMPQADVLADRASSALVDSHLGSEFDTALIPPNHVSQAGELGLFKPQDGAGQMKLENLAYALYVFELPGFTQGRYFTNQWAVAPSSGQLWLGLGNQQDQRWEWINWEPDQDLLIDGIEQYLTEDGLLLAVMLLTGTGDFLLERLEFSGQPPSVLAVTPTRGEPGTQVIFTPTLNGSEPITFQWNFGSGAIPGLSDEIEPEVYLGAVGIYGASLTLSNELGTDVFEFELIVGLPEIVSIEPLSGATGDTINATAEVESEQPLTYSWNFGGGAVPDTSDEPTPLVTLGTGGEYSSQLVVTNIYGSDSAGFPLTINNPPVAMLSGDPTTGRTPLNVQFDASGSYDPEGGEIHFLWDWRGDGTYDYDSGTNPIVEHIYDPRGWRHELLCKLKVTDNDGLSNTVDITITVLGWESITTIDTVGTVGPYTSIELDSLDQPWISYYGYGSLKIAHLDQGVWIKEPVSEPGDVGKFSSLELDSTDRPYISYVDTTNSNLKLTSYINGQWEFQTVDTGGRFCSLALDSLDQPHIAYGGANYAYYDSLEWHFESFASNSDYTSLALDANDYPHISFHDNDLDTQRYAHYNGATWTYETIQDTASIGFASSIVVDNQGHPHISHYGNPWLLYSYFDGAVWETVEIGDEWYFGKWNSIALNDQMEPLIACNYDDSVDPSNLYLASNETGTFEVSLLDDRRDCGQHNSIAIDSTGKSYISYYDSYYDQGILLLYVVE